MDGSFRQIELLAGDHDEPLQGRARHGRSGLLHALGYNLEIGVATANVGKDEKRMPVKLPVGLKFMPQTGRQRHDAILVAFAVADDQFVLRSLDVVDGQCQAFA